MSWKPEVQTGGSEWTPNGLAFATKEEAEIWASDLMFRWTLVTDTRAVESDQPVNHKLVDGVVSRLEEVGA